MTHLQKLRTISIHKWVYSNLFENHVRSSNTPQRIGSFNIAQNPRRFYRRKTNVDQTSLACADNVHKVSVSIIREAQAALLDYLHSTRSLHFTDAEHMSKNSPFFLEKILKKIKDEENIGQCVVRYLQYHPINEFEPFFESAGLKPCEYNPLLPHNLMYLSDDDLLLKNYHALCNYGIERSKIGKIFMEAMEVLRYDFGVLQSKLQAYEDLGFSQCFIAKVIVCSPQLLIGDVNMEFAKVIEILKNMGIEFCWIEEHLEWNSCNWSKMFNLLSLYSQIGFSENQLGIVIRQHPRLLLEDSGDRALTLIGLLLKFGCTMNEICSMFVQFPQIQVAKFVLNLRQCVQFLHEIEMGMQEIGNIVCSHPILLGSCALKKTNSLLVLLNAGKKRLCKCIKENPQEIKKWVRGTRVVRFPSSGVKERSKMLKLKFLLDLGFVQNSKQMEKALKFIRASGGKLQERFDCFVNAGLDRKDVCEMIRLYPQILNQTKSVIETKIDFLVNNLGYPLSTLVIYPSYIYFTAQRIKLRLSMYSWLIDQGAAESMLALSTLISCSHKVFIQRYVNRHPEGLQIWKKLKKEICTK
ncbi:hypothetical protein ACOSP7_028551 [Xanthoceras sorbifolium]